MKKITLFIFPVLIFVFGIFTFAYNPPSVDEFILSKVYISLDKKINENPGKMMKFIPSLNMLSQKYEYEKPRISYFLSEISKYINQQDEEVKQDKNDENKNEKQQEEQENQVENGSSLEIICNESLKDLTKNYNKKTFIVSSEQEIRDILKNAKNRSDQDLRYEIVIKKGKYTLSNGFRTNVSKIIYRGETGNPEDVVLQGKGMKGGITHVFRVVDKDIIIGDMSIGKVANHPIQVHGEKNADNFLLHNAIIFDGKEQLLKGSFDKNNPDKFTDNGVIQCSKFYYTDGQGIQDYMGGIDIHRANHRLIQYNHFEDIKTPSGTPAEHAVHFRNNSHDVVVRGNKIVNCDRGIGFGLGSSAFSSGKIINNYITHDKTIGDVGIGLESASNVLVKGNTVLFENDYRNAIEYRFKVTKNIKIINNKVNSAIRSRNGGSAELLNNEISN